MVNFVQLLHPIDTCIIEIRKSDEQRNSMCLPSSSNGNMMSKNYEIMEVEDDNLVKREVSILLFFFERELQASINLMSFQIKHTCKLCSDNFYSLRDYRKHLSTHKDQKMHQCKCCEASFNKIVSYQRKFCSINFPSLILTFCIVE